MSTTLEPIAGAVVPTFRVLAAGMVSVGWVREDASTGDWVARNFNTGRHPAKIRRFVAQKEAVNWLIASGLPLS
jgi:hypothetical protein